MILMLRGDTPGDQYPVPPPVHADEQPALAVLAGGIDVQRVSLAKGRAQLRHTRHMQRLQVREKPVTERREAAAGQLDAPLLIQLGLDLPALLVLQVAGTSHVDNQIVARALARRDLPGECLGADHRMPRILGAVFERLDRPKGACCQGHHLPRATLVDLQRPIADRAPLGLGDKRDTGGIACRACGSRHFRRRPARLAGVSAQPAQDFELPPFLPIDSRSYRAKTASTCSQAIGGECPRR